ncbi:MAG: orotate phosphoribosyltransferase [Acidobacteriota bacterium]|nr:MAG: orotate phosphoribosyltransferase [Acidobacteriota bacterium]
MDASKPESVLKHFRESEALLEGHFVLSSGLHSPKYLQCARALQYPADATVFGHAIADHFVDESIETVCSPAIGGLVIGYEVARALNVRFIWTERKEGEMVLRRGFTIREGERFLVVEDVITTGGSTIECMEAIRAFGANVVAAASIIDRSGGKADVGVPRISLVEMDVPVYEPEKCPLCESGEKAIKPGSRDRV